MKNEPVLKPDPHSQSRPSPLKTKVNIIKYKPRYAKTAFENTPAEGAVTPSVPAHWPLQKQKLQRGKKRNHTKLGVWILGPTLASSLESCGSPGQQTPLICACRKVSGHPNRYGFQKSTSRSGLSNSKWSHFHSFRYSLNQHLLSTCDESGTGLHNAFSLSSDAITTVRTWGWSLLSLWQRGNRANKVIFCFRVRGKE